VVIAKSNASLSTTIGSSSRMHCKQALAESWRSVSND